MMGKFLNKNWLTIFIALLVTGIFFVGTVYAGTLSCVVQSSACGGSYPVEIFEMQNTTNSHAGLPAASYTNLVCCGGVTGLSNLCSGTFATALKLSGATNAHARQNQLADYVGANNACISVPSGGTVSVGYQATNCTGFDTTLASMIGTTNSHVGNGSWVNGTTKICATAAGAGTITADIVDASYVSVTNPTMAMSAANFSFSCQTKIGSFGTASQQIYINNSNGANNGWTLTVAAQAVTNVWDSAGTDYDFNDPTSSGCADGADSPDTLGGQMTVDPSVATLAVGQCGSCTTNNISKGSSAAFNQGTTDTITLLTATAASDDVGDWKLTGVNISQKIPAEQPAASDHNINMVLTVTAN